MVVILISHLYLSFNKELCIYDGLPDSLWSVFLCLSVYLSVCTVEPAGLSLQTIEQVFVASRCSTLDGLDKSRRQSWVAVAQLGQLHRKRSQPPTEHLTPLVWERGIIYSQPAGGVSDICVDGICPFNENKKGTQHSALKPRGWFKYNLFALHITYNQKYKLLVFCGRPEMLQPCKAIP